MTEPIMYIEEFGRLMRYIVPDVKLKNLPESETDLGPMAKFIHLIFMKYSRMDLELILHD